MSGKCRLAALLFAPLALHGATGAMAQSGSLGVSQPSTTIDASIASNLPVLSVGAKIASPLARLPVGKSSFVFVDYRGDPQRPLRIWLYVPEGCDTSCPILMVMHGVRRNGEDYLDGVVELASKGRFIAVAPEFSRQFFPADEDYSLGRVSSEANPERWAFAVPEHLFDQLRLVYGLSHSSYRLFGHSAGGQFVHRLHMFYPEHRAQPIIAANPGWYTQFEWGTADARFSFPYTTIGSKIDRRAASAALARPFVLMLGTEDIDANDPNLNKSAGANSQGKNRLARGNAFFDSAQRAAQALNAPFVWQRTLVPGVGHDGVRMSAAAIRLMEETTK